MEYQTLDEAKRAADKRHYAEMDMCKQSSLNCAAREMTVGELLDRRIEAAERLLRSLQDLKGSLPGSFLASGYSRVAPLMGS